MTLLLVDAGNTRLKWTLATADGIGEVHAVAHDAAGDSVGQGERTVARIVVSSVVAPERTARLVAALARRFPAATIETPATPAAACGVTNAYDEPVRLGIDRFFALVAARARGTEPALTVSLGTALAIDALARDGRHLGGWIAPAPDLMRSALLGATARIEWLRAPAPSAAFGRSTEAGLDAGTWQAAAALVDRAAARLAAELGEIPRVLVSGGAGERLAALVHTPHAIAPHLVLEGLRHYALACGG